MSNTTNTFGTPDNVVGNMNGFFKDTWAKNLGRILPDGVILLKEIAFNPKASQAGNLFH